MPVAFPLLRVLLARLVVHVHEGNAVGEPVLHLPGQRAVGQARGRERARTRDLDGPGVLGAVAPLAMSR